MSDARFAGFGTSRGERARLDRAASSVLDPWLRLCSSSFPGQELNEHSPISPGHCRAGVAPAFPGRWPLRCRRANRLRFEP